MRKSLSIVLLFSLLAGCQSLAYQGDQRNAVQLKPGTRFIITQPLPIPKGRWAVYLQKGRVLDGDHTDPWEFACEVDPAQRDDQDRKISHGVLVLSKTAWYEEYFGRDVVIEETRFYFPPGNPVGISTLYCRAWTQSPNITPITIGELKETLSPWFRIDAVPQ